MIPSVINGDSVKVEIFCGGSSRTLYAKRSSAVSALSVDSLVDPLASLGLTRSNYTHLLVPAENIKSEDLCTVCSSELGSRDSPGPPVSLGCGHMFHKKCISKWAWDNITCPNCRKEFGDSSRN